MDERITTWLAREFSWSQISSWEYSKDQWYSKYILGEVQPETPALIFGKAFAKSVEDGAQEAPVTTFSKREYRVTASIGDIALVGQFDCWEPETKELIDHKTGVKPWDQKRTDGHRQLTFYAMLLYLSEKIKPEDIRFQIQWIPTGIRSDFTFGFLTDPPVVHTFHTKRTMLDVLTILSDIKRARKEMKRYALRRLAAT